MCPGEDREQERTERVRPRPRRSFEVRLERREQGPCDGIMVFVCRGRPCLPRGAGQGRVSLDRGIPQRGIFNGACSTEFVLEAPGEATEQSTPDAVVGKDASPL